MWWGKGRRDFPPIGGWSREAFPIGKFPIAILRKEERKKGKNKKRRKGKEKEMSGPTHYPT
jgi:hypothetical protein